MKLRSILAIGSLFACAPVCAASCAGQSESDPDVGTAAAAFVRQFHNPLLNGLWVDACVIRLGSPDCSNAAQEEVADEWCKAQGASTWTNYTTDNPGADHETMRLTSTSENCVAGRRFEHCGHCGYHFTEIDCLVNR
jgi:hypothetical protein